MTLSNDQIFAALVTLLTPFNRKSIAIAGGTTFSSDLDLDSLQVMDLVAAIEDHFDITIPLNMLPDMETVGSVADAVEQILKGR